MAENQENTSKENLSKFLDKNKKICIAVIVVMIVAVIGFITGEVAGTKAKEKNLTKIDSISYNLTEGSTVLEDAELDARRTAAMNELASFTGKSGVVGVRANTLAAEIAYQKADFAAAVEYWNAAAAKSKNAYTAPLANYNAGVCYEQLKDLDKAAASYKAAADVEDFVLGAHAKFSYGRVLETQGKYAEAVTAYTELNDKKPNDTWAKIAKSRIIALQAEGKAE